MAVRRFLIAVSLLACAAAPVRAEASTLDMALRTACTIDRVREIIAGAEASAADAAEADRLIVENTADWLPDYQSFATGQDAAALRAAADAGTLSCRRLLPVAAVAASAARISKAGAAVAPGALLEPCASGEGLCVPKSLAGILKRCGPGLFRLPLRGTC